MMITFRRAAPRVLMTLAGFGALAATIGAFSVLGHKTPDTWAVLAASFAVITSLMSAWTAMSVLEIERDKRKPDVNCILDFTSRQGLALFRMENHGGSIAYDIELHWDEPIVDHHGKHIGFGSDNGSTKKIFAFRPGQRLTKVVDSAHQTVIRGSGKIYRGHVLYRDAAGGRHINNFTICADDFNGTSMNDDDVRAAAVQLQKIPEHLEKIARSVERISQTPQKRLL